MGKAASRNANPNPKRKPPKKLAKTVLGSTVHPPPRSLVYHEEHQSRPRSLVPVLRLRLKFEVNLTFVFAFAVKVVVNINNDNILLLLLFSSFPRRISLAFVSFPLSNLLRAIRAVPCLLRVCFALLSPDLLSFSPALLCMVVRAFFGTLLGTFFGRNPTWLAIPVGIGAGVYLEQTYRLPDVQLTFLEVQQYLAEMERKYRR